MKSGSLYINSLSLVLRLLFRMYLQSPEHDAFAAAAKLDLDTEFVSTTNIEVTLLLSQGAPISSPPFIALCKQEPERLSVFGMGS